LHDGERCLPAPDPSSAVSTGATVLSPCALGVGLNGMFELTIRSGARPSMPGEDEPGVIVWRDLAGEICAIGEVRGGHRWMNFPDLASFRFAANEPVVAFADPDTSPDLIRDAFTRSVVPMMLQALGTEVLHASGFLAPCGVVALGAVSETGKSTLARAVARRGYTQWADDAVVFEFDRGQVVSRSLPFAPRVHDDSAAALGGERLLPERDLDAVAPLAAVLLLERVEPAPEAPVVAWRLLAPAEAFPLVLEHAYCFDLEDEQRKRRMMDQYLDLANRVPVVAFRYRSGFDVLDRVVDGLLDAVVAICGAPAMG
jgi:hypothetical protein